MDAKKACGKALIGTGKTEVELLFAESRRSMLKSNLLVFNGGLKGGKTTLLIHAYLIDAGCRVAGHHGRDHRNTTTDATG